MSHRRIAAIVRGPWEFRFPQILPVVVERGRLVMVRSDVLDVEGDGRTESAAWEAFGDAVIAHWRRFMDATEALQSADDLAVRMHTRAHVVCAKRPAAGTVHATVTDDDAPF